MDECYAQIAMDKSMHQLAWIEHASLLANIIQLIGLGSS